ncbi:MAG: hypothetical protein HeimC3_25960 [Candidatus Heimdallarchaeota archaeon LC_3]|nr:MAG: hypothetical protein HeimC3_25960 [Candidatus Heimdallarchaeota archaeon LC_3]
MKASIDPPNSKDFFLKIREDYNEYKRQTNGHLTGIHALVLVEEAEDLYYNIATLPTVYDLKEADQIERYLKEYTQMMTEFHWLYSRVKLSTTNTSEDDFTDRIFALNKVEGLINIIWNNLNHLKQSKNELFVKDQLELAEIQNDLVRESLKRIDKQIKVAWITFGVASIAVLISIFMYIIA